MNIGNNSPRILYVRLVWRHKAAIGIQLRCISVLRALQQVGTVEVVILDDKSTNSDLMPEPDCEFKMAYGLELKRRPERGLTEKLRWTFDPRMHYPHDWGVDRDAMRRVVRSLNEFDLIWFSMLYSADLFPNAVWPRSVVDINDVPSTYERGALRIGGPLERAQALRRLFAWRRRERLLGERFSVLAVCSEKDRQYLRRIGVDAHVHIIPNGFERPHAEPVRSPATPPRIGFIGVYDYPPNLEGIQWFVSKCWPRIKSQVPGVRLRLVGEENKGLLARLGPDVDRLGPLVDASEEISTWSAMVVPIRLGAGTCLKIAHGFSQKCPIVSTPLGARGYGAVHGCDMYLADSAGAFSKACIKAIREPDEAARMAERAWIEFLEKWAWDAIRPRVWAAAEDCLRRPAEADF